MASAQDTQKDSETTAMPISPTRTNLLEMLIDGSDVQLVFQTADNATETVPAHSFILKRWSSVLAEALIVGSGSSGSTQAGIKIPMNGSSKEDWLLVMEIIYPVTPAVDIGWATVESLLRIAHRYHMPAMLQRVGSFVKLNMKQLDLTPDSKLFIWKWVVILDRYGLGYVSEACINARSGQNHGTDVHKLVTVCPLTQLRKLSSGTLATLVVAISGQLPRHGALYCSVCKAFTYEKPKQGVSYNVCCGVCGSGVGYHTKLG